jgi:integrase
MGPTAASSYAGCLDGRTRSAQRGDRYPKNEERIQGPGRWLAEAPQLGLGPTATVMGRRHLDATALGRRYNRARDAIGLRPLRWHDLRHTFGSLLVAAGIDTVTVKAAMGHERITTTERYLHARPATLQDAAFTAAFATQDVNEPALAS